jgi:hypothetical protein
MSKQVVHIITTVLLPLSPRENPYNCAHRGPITTPLTMGKEKQITVTKLKRLANGTERRPLAELDSN